MSRRTSTALAVALAVTGCGPEDFYLGYQREPPAVPGGEDVLTPAVYLDGLAAWRRAHPRGACANCHSPDGIDLAFYAYSDGTILRRALGYGASEADAWAIVALVRGLRNAYGVNPVDPIAYGFLQPGGAVLPGELDPLADEEELFARERSFYGQLLASDHPYLRPGRVDSLEEAAVALQEIAEVDPRTVPVGFATPRWSTDAFDGLASHNVVDWLPDFASFPRAGREAAWYGLHDQYLVDPTAEHLWLLVDALEDFTDGGVQLPLTDDDGTTFNMAYVGRGKYRAVLIASHMMRTNNRNVPDVDFGAVERLGLVEAPPSQADKEALVVSLQRRLNPLFQLGGFLAGSSAADGPIQDSVVAEKDWNIGTGERWKEHSRRQFARGFMHLGWSYDPALQFAAANARRGEFLGNYWLNGAALHGRFVASTHFAHNVLRRDTRYAAHDNGRVARPFRDVSGLGVNLFFAGQYPEDLRAEVRRFHVNDLRARVLLLEAALLDGSPVVNRERTLELLDAIAASAPDHEVEPHLSGYLADIARARDLAAAAEEASEPPPAVFEARALVNETSGAVPPAPLIIPEELRRGPPTGPFGAAFAQYCAGCHGDDGRGRPPGGELAGREEAFEGYPDLTQLTSFPDFVAIVRGGAAGSVVPMPAFPEPLVSDEALAAMFQALQDR